MIWEEQSDTPSLEDITTSLMRGKRKLNKFQDKRKS